MDLSGAWKNSKIPLRKGEISRLKIIEASYACIVELGYYRTTFQTIADRAGVSQPLVVKTFKARENIFLTVAFAVLEKAIHATEKRMSGQSIVDLNSAIKAYLDVSIDMVNSTENLGKFYMNLHYLATYEDSIMALNKKIRSNAVERVQAMLSHFYNLDTNELDIKELAGSIHDLLVGHILHSESLGSKPSKKKLHSLVDVMTGKSVLL